MSSSSDSPLPAGPESPGAFVAPSIEDLAKALPQFEITDVLGQGGMGAVYKARQPRLNRFVAIKLLPAFTGSDEFNFAERFEREAQAMAHLNHSNIVTVHDFGETDDGLRYIVMEYVDGPDLESLIQGGQLTIQHTMSWIPQICSALQYAHERGVVHRDIKPANILINQDGEAKVVDFGLATLVGARQQEASNASEPEIAMGTPEYAPPEAMEEGATIDHRADIYSLGVLFYEMLTGQVPSGAWKAPSEFGHDSDVRLDDIIARAIQAKPDHRYQSVSEISHALSQLRHAPKVVVPATGRKKLLTGPGARSTRAAPSGRKKRPVARHFRSAGMSGPAKFGIGIAAAALVTGFVWLAMDNFGESNGPKLPQPVAQTPPERPKVSPAQPKPPSPEQPTVPAVQPDPPKPIPKPPELALRPLELPLITPPTPRPDLGLESGWMDVLSKLDLETAEIGGSWTLADGAVTAAERVSSSDQPRLELPTPVGDTYELELVFQRASGEGNIVVMLPIAGEHYVPLYLSGYYGRQVGIHGLDRESAASSRNPTGFQMTLENGRDHRVSIRVDRNLGSGGETARIVLRIDGDELFDWSGPVHLLPEKDGFGWIPRDKNHIALGTVSPTTFSVIRVRTGLPAEK